MRKVRFIPLLVAMLVALVLAACPAAAPAPAPADTGSGEAAATEAEAPAEAPAPSGDRIQIRWFVGLGTGTNEAQIPTEEEVVRRFNEMQDEIELVVEIVPNTSARDTLATQIASGNGPDIVGPVGWNGSNAFYGQYLDLGPFIELEGYDLSQFNEALVSMYQNEEGAQVGLPFAVFPAAVFFQRAAFDEAGLNYPPAAYGDKYVMPDGTEVDWTWDVVTELAKILTVDSAGNDATMGGFDANDISQYGFIFQWQTHPNYIGSYLGGAQSLLGEDGQTVTVPDSWVDSWKWWHDGMYGDQPFIPTGPVTQAPEFGSGNAFASGKVAMAVTPAWYTCCIADAGDGWDLGVMPANNDGVINSRIDADTFRLLSDTKHPEEAFTVLSYLIGEASLDLLGVYGGMPARTADFDSWLQDKQEQFPGVTNWDPIAAGLSYPDVPTAEAWMPGYNEAWDRLVTLDSLMQNEADLDLDAEAVQLQADLQAIVDKALSE
ncbi:MAG: extracellular solute-binding protein [Caldilineaceae bacterium]|nr:extracellular solute-binding protein [Caldilineaceae bacterium]